MLRPANRLRMKVILSAVGEPFVTVGAGAGIGGRVGLGAFCPSWVYRCSDQQRAAKLPKFPTLIWR